MAKGHPMVKPSYMLFLSINSSVGIPIGSDRNGSFGVGPMVAQLQEWDEPHFWWQHETKMKLHLFSM